MSNIPEKDKKENIDIDKEMENSLREENDKLVDHLYQNVISIKNHALEMGAKITSSNVKIEEMDKKYTQSNSLVRKSINQLSELFNNSSNCWCYLILFIFFVVLLLFKMFI